MDNYLAELFERDLLKLKDELLKFKDETNIWKVTEGVTNSVGTLTLHLLGNLNFTIGTHLAENGYVRNREQEFSQTGVSREKLVTDIEATIEVIKKGLTDISPATMEKTYALEMAGQHSTAFYISFFYGHFSYHLGQINYLRRVLEAKL